MPAHAPLDRALASAQPAQRALLVHPLPGICLRVEAIDDSGRGLIGR